MMIQNASSDVLPVVEVTGWHEFMLFEQQHTSAGSPITVQPHAAVESPEDLCCTDTMENTV